MIDFPAIPTHDNQTVTLAGLRAWARDLWHKAMQFHGDASITVQLVSVYGLPGFVLAGSMTRIGRTFSLRSLAQAAIACRSL